jgi:hypothetical protein
MVNFNLIVESVLLNEAIVGVPRSALWFNEVLNKHESLFGPVITDEDLSDFFDLLDDATIPDQKGLELLSKIRIFDFMKSLYDNMNPKPKDLNTFKTALAEPSLKSVADSLKINQLNSQNKNNWTVKNQNVIDLKQRAEVLADKQSVSSFSTYENMSILSALQEIINKRISVFSRVANLKNPAQPFNKLIIDIFKTPEQYLSGQKKYSSDFEAVDKMYITDVIDIAIAAKDFFASEISRLKMTPETQDTPQTPEPQESPVPAEVFRMGDSLNSFENLVNSVLLNELNIKQSFNNIKQKALDWEKYYLAKPEVKERYKRMKETLKQDEANYINFISGKPIQYKLVDPNTGNVLKQIKTTDPSQYTLGKIDDLKTAESKKLIDSIKKLTTYVRSKLGAGELMRKTGSAIAAAGQAGKAFAGVT